MDDSCLFLSNSQVIRSVTILFFRLRPPPPPPTAVLSFLLFRVRTLLFDLFLVHMALTRIPLPSFTFVLTSDPQSLHEYPTAIKLDSSSSLAMRPTARDYLMVITYLAFVL